MPDPLSGEGSLARPVDSFAVRARARCLPDTWAFTHSLIDGGIITGPESRQSFLHHQTTAFKNPYGLPRFSGLISAKNPSQSAKIHQLRCAKSSQFAHFHQVIHAAVAKQTSVK
jgi:hypothetical protein